MKIFLFLIMLPSLFSLPNMERKIDEISYRSQNSATVCLIKLTDGSIWKWMPDAYSENLLRNWKEGDPILIEAVHQPGFILHNLTRPNFSPQVALSFQSYTIYPALSAYDSSTALIALDDGTTWELLDLLHRRTLSFWSVGDRIVPVKGPHGSFQLVNLDIPFENRCPIDRHVDVVPLDLPSNGAIAERGPLFFQTIVGQNS